MTTTCPTTDPRTTAWRPLLLLGGLVAVVLVAFAGGYGYHRDELYFLAAGRHLAWGYSDQGPLTPLVARLTDLVAPGSLTVLRVPSALVSGAVVVVTGLLARDLGGTRRAQVVAASCVAVASVVLIVGHLLSTTTFDVLAWTLATWLLVRAVALGDRRAWPWLGLVVGLALLNKPLIAFLGLAVLIALLAVGPRDVLRRPGPWVAAAIAVVLWSPWLVWQASHGWPQLDVSSAIADGGSASSQPRWALVPFQLLLVSPVLAPVWIAGLVALLRRPALRRVRFLGVAWFVLVVLFLATGGKPYYLAGTFPVLLAAGAIETDAWLARGATRARRGWLVAAVVTSAAVSMVIALPVLPARDAGPAVAANADVAETVGWPAFARTVAGVHDRAGRGAVVFTENYGEAGALVRFGPALGVTRVASGHNGFGEWSRPPDRPGPVVVVGVPEPLLRRAFVGCRVAARIADADGLDGDEAGVAVDRCAGTRGPWSRVWGRLRHDD